jgi:hypothetical protein
VANPGDSVTRTTPRGSETVNLPPLDLAHLTQIQVDGANVKGFHVLPAGVIITSSAAVVLPAGTVAVVDQRGAAIAGAQTRILPRKLPASEWDTLEARVEVLDAGGTVIASTSQKTFFPTAWTDAQVQQAIYAAFIEAYQGGQGPLAWMAGTTSAGVVIELVVTGAISAAGARLKEIKTAHPQAAQRLGHSHQP